MHFSRKQYDAIQDNIYANNAKKPNTNQKRKKRAVTLPQYVIRQTMSVCQSHEFSHGSISKSKFQGLKEASFHPQKWTHLWISHHRENVFHAGGIYTIHSHCTHIHNIEDTLVNQSPQRERVPHWRDLHNTFSQYTYIQSSSIVTTVTRE